MSAALPSPTAIPEILIVPDKRLRTRARPVTDADRPALEALMPSMFDAMYRAPGIGLAAPQIGLSLRFFIMDLGPDHARTPLILINPTIIAASETLATREEGCLSLPNQYAEITRPARITATYEDLAGVKHRIEGEDLLAACIQHEIDHLDGILFVDHLTPLKRNILLRKLAKEQREKSDDKAVSRARR